MVRVDWDATGAVTVALTGALAGGAEERCVQEAMAGFALDDPGEGGRCSTRCAERATSVDVIAIRLH